MADNVRSLKARWVFPVSGPPLTDGIVVVECGCIAEVTPAGTRTPDVDLGNVALVPGFVNAHIHLDLGGMRGQAPPSPDFTGWLRQVITHRRQRSTEQVRADIRAGIAESIRSGVTLLGDISSDGSSWEELSAASIRAVVFREMLGLPQHRASKSWAEADAWRMAHPATATCRPGLSPHAPYSVRASLFFAASASGAPFAVHLAESPAEMELLAHHLHRRGPFVSFLRDLGVWAPDGLAQNIKHVLGLCNGLSPALIIHGNYLPLDAPIPANASLIYCPRTHRAFGHPPHPFRDFLARGLRVALGTDSLASNPDLDMLAEARYVHRQYPDFSPAALLRMLTLSGAGALGWADETGSLEPGKSADLVALPLPQGDFQDPHQMLFQSDHRVSQVFWRGQTVFP